jgi:5-hydroxyisourate hydrolase
MEGRLTTAVIDAVYGTPANGMLVDLFRLPGGQAERQHLKTIETDARGAVAAPLLGEDALLPATYELLFHVGRYFRAERTRRDEAPFLDVVPFRFTVADPNRAYHLVLLVSPWSYTAYRA